MSHQIGSWESKHGKAVSKIEWPLFDGVGGKQILETDERKMHCEFYYLGDHAEVWIVVKVGGVEQARHNVKSLDSIHWSN